MCLQSLPLIWRPGLTMSDSEIEEFFKTALLKNSVSFLLSQVFVFKVLVLVFDILNKTWCNVLAMQERH